MEFRILGPLEVARNGDAIPLGPAKERALLGALLLEANAVVSIDRLVDEVWGERPPPSAQKVVQVYVSQLRKRLGAADCIVTRPPGYMVTAPEAAIDARRFEHLVEAARARAETGDHEAAVDTFTDALALWRGPVLADVVFESALLGEVDRLHELRLTAVAERMDSELALGRHERVVGELEALVAEHPLRERFRAQLMLALYGSGRQADALAVYQDARRHLVDELGIEPGPALQELERSILRHEPALDAPRGTPAPDRPARRARGAVAAVVLLAALAAVTLAFVFRPSADLMLEARSLGRIDARANAIVDRLALGSRPVAVLADASSVWVVGREGTLTRIDVPRMRVASTLPLGAHPTSGVLARRALWIGAADRTSILRVDVVHDVVTRRLALTPPSARAVSLGTASPGLAYGGGSLWIAHGSTSVLRIDPQTARVAAVLDPPAGATGALAFGGDALWVAGTNTVSRVSLETSAVTSTIRLDGTPSALAAGGGALWAALPAEGKIVRVDVESEAVEAISVGGAATAIAVGSEAVWVLVPSSAEVLRIDPVEGRVVATIGTGATPTAIAVTGDNVWVAVT